MQFLDVTLPSLAENLALDEALLLAAEYGDGAEVLRFWEWPKPAVVLGAGGRIADDVEEAACAADAVPIARRSSGGGTVLLGRGCLIYSLVLSYESDSALNDIRLSYRFILDRIGQALAEGVGVVERAGISDLTLAGRKFSGTAQQRKRCFLLHHGTILYDSNLSFIACYLREPPRRPEYRAGREHLKFVFNLPLPRAEIERRLRQAWTADALCSAWPTEEVQRLAADKYAKEEFIRRR